MPDRVATRLYIPAPLTTDAAAIALDASAAHRLQNVLRLRSGAAIAGFNERDGEWLCRIVELGRGRAAVQAITQRRGPEPAPDLWLLFAPIKRARLDWLIEKATELGAGALVPISSERAQMERLNRQRLQAVAIASAEQSERLTVPEVRDIVRLEQALAAWPAERRLVLCDESGVGTPIGEALTALPAGTPAAVLIGPEGGFTERELDAIGKLPIVTRVGLGPRVLRAETAALAALAVFQAIAGDWRRTRSRL